MTPNDIRKAANKLITEQCPWEIEKNDAPELARLLFYVCGIVDMAERICENMEGKQ